MIGFNKLINWCIWRNSFQNGVGLLLGSNAFMEVIKERIDRRKERSEVTIKAVKKSKNINYFGKNYLKRFYSYYKYQSISK